MKQKNTALKNLGQLPIQSLTVALILSTSLTASWGGEPKTSTKGQTQTDTNPVKPGDNVVSTITTKTVTTTVESSADPQDQSSGSSQIFSTRFKYQTPEIVLRPFLKSYLDFYRDMSNGKWDRDKRTEDDLTRRKTELTVKFEEAQLKFAKEAEGYSRAKKEVDDFGKSIEKQKDGAILSLRTKLTQLQFEQTQCLGDSSKTKANGQTDSITDCSTLSKEIKTLQSQIENYDFGPIVKAQEEALKKMKDVQKEIEKRKGEWETATKTYKSEIETVEKEFPAVQNKMEKERLMARRLFDSMRETGIDMEFLLKDLDMLQMKGQLNDQQVKALRAESHGLLNQTLFGEYVNHQIRQGINKVLDNFCALKDACSNPSQTNALKKVLEEVSTELRKGPGKIGTTTDAK